MKRIDLTVVSLSFVFILMNFLPQRVEIAATSVTGGFPLSLFAFLCALLAVILLNLHQKLVIKVELFACLIVLLAGLMLVSIWRNADSGLLNKPLTFHFLATSYLLLPLLGIISIVIANPGQNTIRKLTDIFVSLAFLQAITSLLIYLAPDYFGQLMGWASAGSTNTTTRLSATALGGGGIGPLAFLLLVASQLSYARYLESRSLYHASILISCLLCLVLTYSRAPLILAVSGIGGMSALAWYGKNKRAVAAIGVLLLGFVVGATAFFQSVHIDEDYLFREDKASADTIRIISALTAVDLIAQRPWFGYSPGEVYIRNYEDDNDKHLVLSGGYSLKTPHNLFLLLATENGIPFVVLWLIFLATVLRWLWIPRDHGVVDINSHWFILASGIVYSCVSDVLALHVRIAILFWMAVGLGVARSQYSANDNGKCSGSLRLKMQQCNIGE